MNVVILGPSHPWRGGIAHHTASLFEAMRAAGHEVRLYNFSRLYPPIFFPGKTQRDESGQVFSVPAEALYDPIDPRTWLALGRRILAVSPDRLLLQWWHPFFAPGYAAITAMARLAGCEVVMLCHNISPHEATPLDRVLLRLAYALPDRFIVQSDAEAERLERLLAVRARRLPPIDAVAHPRYSIFANDDLAEKSDGDKSFYSLLFFGLVRPYKGLDVLIEALALLPEDIDIRLNIVGEFYEDEDVYRRQIARLGLQDRVDICARYVPNEQVGPIFEAADICVLPYRHATGSGVANIALACGTRLVMSRLPTLEQAFCDEPIHWFEPGDADALSRAIVEALRSPNPQRSADTPRDDGWLKLVDAIIA